MMRLSILVPVYNEGASVADVVRRVATVSLGPVEREIVVVNDGSSDGTGAILDRLTAEIPALRVIHHPFNRGKGAGIRTALAHATGQYIIIQDADLEYDPADYVRLLEPVVAGAARVVYGVRSFARQHWLLRFGNWFLTLATNVLYGCRLHDMETCYKLMPAALVRALRLECSRFDLEPEITAKILRSGHRIHEIPIRYAPRRAKKLSPWRDGLPAVLTLLRYRTWQPAANATAPAATEQLG